MIYNITKIQANEMLAKLGFKAGATSVDCIRIEETFKHGVYVHRINAVIFYKSNDPCDYPSYAKQVTEAEVSDIMSKETWAEDQYQRVWRFDVK